MHKKNYKGRVEKRLANKCIGMCITCNGIHKAITTILSDDDILEYKTNVPLEDEGYTSDIVATTMDGKTIVYECMPRYTLIKPSVGGKLLDISRNYWLKRGINKEDWRLVIDEAKPIDEK